LPFQYILANLLAANEGATGVLFLDDAGETVDLACAAAAKPYDLRVMGAYLGIYLRQIEGVAEAGRLGTPRMIHIERGGLHVYAIPLPEGYHVALVQRRPGMVARARRSLESAAGQLRDEFFPEG
jgi:hypothetical protein